MKKSTIKPIVEIRSSEHNSIAFEAMDSEGGVSLMITTEDSSGSNSFFFGNADELVIFAKRIIDAADSFM